MDQKILDFFKTEREGRCYLIEGKKGAADFFAKEILKTKDLTHPDYICLSPTGKSRTHSIEALQGLRSDAMRLPHSGSHLVIVIDEADKMPASSSQSLLKIFEEPLKTTIFFLVTENRHKLLPTILSRCQMIPFKPLIAEKKVNEPLLKLLSRGRITSYFELQDFVAPIGDEIDVEEGRHEKIALFFSTLLSWYRDMHLLQLDPHTDKLLLQDQKEEISQSLQRGEILSLEKVFKAVHHAKFSFERFTACRQVLETLFLELEILSL